MKKLIFLIILITSISFAQGYGTNAPSAIQSVSLSNTDLDSLAVKVDRLSRHNQTFRYTDTLNAANDTVSYDFNSLYYEALITVRNPAAVTDTLSIARLDAVTGSYTTTAVAIEDCSTRQLLTDNTTVIPGTGLTKMYRITEKNPGKYKAYWKYGADKAARINIITFTGKN